jgi:hypothetical protein
LTGALLEGRAITVETISDPDLDPEVVPTEAV